MERPPYFSLSWITIRPLEKAVDKFIMSGVNNDGKAAKNMIQIANVLTTILSSAK